MKERDNRDQLAKTKVWVVFGISLVITACICYVSYTSFFALTKSIDKLSLPDPGVELINETLQEIVEAENHIQSYILSGNIESQHQYVERTNAAHRKIQQLKSSLGSDHEQQVRVDSLESLFLSKLNNLQSLLKIKEQRQQAVFSGEALQKITHKINDSSSTERTILTREFIKGDYVPAEREQIVIVPDDYKGVKGFFRKMLGGDKSRIDTIKTLNDELMLSKQIRVDTGVIRNTQPDSTLMEVKTILKDVIRQEKRMQKQISEKELALLEQDRAFIVEIRAIVKELKTKASLNLNNSRKEATATIERTTRFIIAAGLFGLLMSGFFLFLILKDMAGAYFYRKQLEKEKATTEKLAKAKEEFMSNMSHEIRTPLQSIQGFSELMGQTPLNNEQRHFLRAIKYSNDYLSQLINDVLDEAKIEAGMLQLASQPFDLIATIEELKVVYERVAKEKKTTFNIHRSGVDLSKIQLIGDAVRMRQVLINLVSNAIKFTEEGEVALNVDTEIETDRAVLTMTVRDTGCGIAEELQSVIFDPFTQEQHADRDKNYKGTGLGLSISKKITEAMGGSISFVSQKNKGTTFTVVLKLPFEWKDSVAEAAFRQTSKVNSSDKIDAYIMVVEDDGWNATLLKEILQKVVAKVKVFQNANAALAYLKECDLPIDLIFTDIQMPEMNGKEFLARLRADGFSMPVIALTAHVQIAKLDELKAEGFDGVFSKPYKSRDIHSILAQHLNFGEPTASEEETAAPKNGSGGLDFSIIRQFSGEDETGFQELLKTLVENNQRQLLLFETYIKNENIKDLADLCHQMKTTYDNLDVYSVSESLASVELHHEMGNDQRALQSAHQVWPQLPVVLEQIQSHLKPQSHIS